jgi:hypothetical protein
MQKIIKVSVDCPKCGSKIDREILHTADSGRCFAYAVDCHNCDAVLMIPYIEREATDEERKLEEMHREQYYDFMACLIRKYGHRVLKAQRERKEAQEKGNQA